MRGFATNVLALLLGTMMLQLSASNAQELTYPRVIHIRYEAQDPRVGGHFIAWVEREKIWYGLDSKLYPPRNPST